MAITTGASDGATAITDARRRYKAGVLKYRQMGYWEPDYVSQATEPVWLFPHHPLDCRVDRSADRLRYLPRQGVQGRGGAEQPGTVLRLGRVRHHSFRRGLDRQHDGEPDRQCVQLQAPQGRET